jgi:formamidopyrimidine-DNA glycosylase
MPELPEVETVARGLRKLLPGRRILAVRLGKTDFIEDPPAVERLLPNSRISDVRRHGKFLLFDLESSEASSPALSLLIHLGMTGQIVVCPPEAPIPPHTHVFLTLDDGREFRYTDIRRFGNIRILEDEARQTILRKLGTDPLEVTEDEFVARLKARGARIKALLLDQSMFSGLGNIYTDESLWRARIHPARVATKLRDEEFHRLYRAVRDVLKEAIRFRGSSVSDYVDADGNRGNFQLRHRVYRRKGQKCFRCGAAINRVIVAGRSSYFCPHCQTPPRKQRGTAHQREKLSRPKGTPRRRAGVR